MEQSQHRILRLSSHLAYVIIWGDRLLAYMLAIVVVLVAALLAFGLAALLHLQGAAYLIFVIIVLLLGIAAAVTIIVHHLRAKKEKEQQGEPAGTAATAELDLLLNDANRKLRTSQQGAKTLEALPLLYILGETGLRQDHDRAQVRASIPSCWPARRRMKATRSPPVC